jgi:NAD(P)-dependent dehydrogenase (short-subunit alcohol dehydrogenase family)
MGTALRDKSALVIGRGSGIARAIVEAARSEGAQVIVAGRDAKKLHDAYDGELQAEAVDVTDDASIQALAEATGPVDHVITTASARAAARCPISTARSC